MLGFEFRSLPLTLPWLCLSSRNTRERTDSVFRNWWILQSQSVSIILTIHHPSRLVNQDKKKPSFNPIPFVCFDSQLTQIRWIDVQWLSPLTRPYWFLGIRSQSSWPWSFFRSYNDLPTSMFWIACYVSCFNRSPLNHASLGTFLSKPLSSVHLWIPSLRRIWPLPWPWVACLCLCLTFIFWRDMTWTDPCVVIGYLATRRYRYHPSQYAWSTSSINGQSRQEIWKRQSAQSSGLMSYVKVTKLISSSITPTCCLRASSPIQSAWHLTTRLLMS